MFLFVPAWLDGILKGMDNGVALWLSGHVIPVLREVRSTIFALWLAYSVVWMAYGMRLISTALLQVGPELEEAARAVGASRGQVTRDVQRDRMPIRQRFDGRVLRQRGEPAERP